MIDKPTYREMSNRKLQSERIRYASLWKGDMNHAPIALLLEIERRKKEAIPKFNPNYQPSPYRND